MSIEGKIFKIWEVRDCMLNAKDAIVTILPNLKKILQRTYERNLRNKQTRPKGSF